MLMGILTALVTPFRDGIFDETAFRRIIEWQLQQCVHGLVPCGTTGESATLSTQEHRSALEICVQTVAGRVPVIAGAGSCSTALAIEHVRHAKQIGADAALVVTPYYNRPDQEGLFAHYAAINDAVQLPIILYNVPKRTGVDLSIETAARLSQLPNIVGLKDATGDLARVALLRALCAPDFVLLSGDDPTQLGFLAQGGHGCISVTANVAPKACAQLQEAALAGDYANARALDARLAPLNQALFASPSPGPTKFALSELGMCAPEVRLPLLPAPPALHARIREAMLAAGVGAI